MLRTLAAHMDYITAVAVTPDARHAVSASADGTAIVWELETGQPVHTFSEHEQGITALALARDGVRAMSASQDGRILVWDVERARLLHAFQGHDGQVAALALAADGGRAVSGGFDGTLVVWDLEGAAAVRKIALAHADAIWHVGLTADGTHAVSLGRDDSLRVWDLDHDLAPIELEGHVTSSRRALAVDGERVISEGPNWALTVWGLDWPAPRQRLEGHTQGLTAIVLTRDGKRAVSASYDTTLRVWDSRARRGLAHAQRPLPGRLRRGRNRRRPSGRVCQRRPHVEGVAISSRASCCRHSRGIGMESSMWH